jgi:transcriptional regulator with XRE-family HTH domain
MDEAVQASLEQIGATLRDARVKALMTQSEVGQLAGVSRQLISRIEQGCNGEISAYFAVAAALSCQFTLTQGAAPDDNAIAGLDLINAQ